MRYGTGDWLEVVYSAGLEVDQSDGRGTSAELRVREAPSLAHLRTGEVHRIRVTVSPSEPGASWRLFLCDVGGVGARAEGDSREGGSGRHPGAWWRTYPGTWQPLDEQRRCIATGRGRVRVDVSLRMESVGDSPDPDLRFVAEPAA